MGSGTAAVAFLFPGQGSQSVGMLAGLAAQTRVVGDSFAEASEALGYDLWKLVADGPEDRLNQTEVTQPAMLAAGVATWRAWREIGGPDPHFMAGHSLGEYSALVAAGTLGFPAAVKLVAERARLMQAATPAGTGAMAAILGLDESPLRQACEAAAEGQIVAPANFNAPGQIVIAGHRDAVQRACARALESGAKRAVPLPVSVPSHCELMRVAARELESFLDVTSFEQGGIPVVHNADVEAHGEPGAIRDALARQLWQPVRWTETVLDLQSRGVTRFAECGPGRVLSGLNRRIVRDAETVALTDLDAMRDTLEKWSQ